MASMSDLAQKTEQLAELVEEFGLESASWKGDGWKVSLGETKAAGGQVVASVSTAGSEPVKRVRKEKKASAPEAVKGNPITSPMMGIFYGSPSPGSAAFVAPGNTVTTGDVVCLIEAMKVFNEITSPYTGRVIKVLAESGQLVQPGDVLVLVE
jgi:acetyl-CoA carboxylase biotin carboxyl carrier protein